LEIVQLGLNIIKLKEGYGYIEVSETFIKLALLSILEYIKGISEEIEIGEEEGN
jgi:hypothetical protein